jgi:hypothetical protein
MEEIVMTLQTITLCLPEETVRRARQSADVLQRPLEDMLAVMLNATLPNVENTPTDMQTEMLRMTWLSDQELWAIVRSKMPVKQQKQLHYLADLQTQHPLTPAEQETLEVLRREYGRYTLRKARAYALLSLRGGKPLLAEE